MNFAWWVLILNHLFPAIFVSLILFMQRQVGHGVDTDILEIFVIFIMMSLWDVWLLLNYVTYLGLRIHELSFIFDWQIHLLNKLLKLIILQISLVLFKIIRATFRLYFNRSNGCTLFKSAESTFALKFIPFCKFILLSIL